MDKHNLKLIDSTYSVPDAKDVLLSLIRDKIKFLNLKILSLEERFGSDQNHLKNRIVQLKSDERELIDMLNALESERHVVKIDCTIQMAVQEAPVPA